MEMMWVDEWIRSEYHFYCYSGRKYGFEHKTTNPIEKQWRFEHLSFPLCSKFRLMVC